MFTDSEIISQYTRADAIRDGELVDVSPLAREAGIRFPVAITRAVHATCVAVPPGVTCQDETGRAWDVVWMLRCAITRSGDGSRIAFGVHVRNDSRERVPPLVQLVAVCGPGDEAEPVITVMLPDED